MPTTWTIFQDLLTYVNGVTAAYLGTNIAAVANAIKPAAFTLLGFYVLIWGFASLRGMIQEPLMDMATRLIKIAFIFGVGIGLAEYNVYVTDLFMQTPADLASAITGSPTQINIMSSLDTILSQGFGITKAFWDKAGILRGDPGMYLMATIVFLITWATTLYAAFLILGSIFMLSLLISIGPIFILSLLFKATEQFFTSWIGQMANYSLLMLLTIMTNVFVMTLFSRGATSITSSAQLDQVIPFVIMGGLSLLVIAQLPNPAAGLAGGLSFASYGAGRLAARLIGLGAKKAVGSAAKLTAKGTKKVARAAWSGYQNSKRNSISNP